MKVNSAAIYGTQPSPFKKLAWGKATRKGGTLYLHVFDWPKDGALLVPMTSTVAKAYLLAEPGKTLVAKNVEQGCRSPCRRKHPMRLRALWWPRSMAPSPSRLRPGEKPARAS